MNKKEIKELVEEFIEHQKELLKALADEGELENYTDCIMDLQEKKGDLIEFIEWLKIRKYL